MQIYYKNSEVMIYAKLYRISTVHFQRTDENRNYAVYRIEDLAFGYFISNLVEDIYISMHGQQIPETLRDMFYPIENTKEADRIKTIDIEEVRNLNTWKRFL